MLSRLFPDREPNDEPAICNGCGKHFAVEDIVVFHVTAIVEGRLELEPVHAEDVVPMP